MASGQNARFKPASLFPALLAAGLLWCVAPSDAWGQTPLPGSGNVEERPVQVFFWSAVLLATATLVAVAFMVIRKRLKAMDDEPPTVNPMGFTLADLREMHDQGQISDEEFDFAKRKMLARTKAQLNDAAGGNLDDQEEPQVTDLGDITDRPAEETPPDGPEKTDGPGSPGD